MKSQQRCLDRKHAMTAKATEVHTRKIPQLNYSWRKRLRYIFTNLIVDYTKNGDKGKSVALALTDLCVHDCVPRSSMWVCFQHEVHLTSWPHVDRPWVGTGMFHLGAQTGLTEGELSFLPLTHPVAACHYCDALKMPFCEPTCCTFLHGGLTLIFKPMWSIILVMFICSWTITDNYLYIWSGKVNHIC